MDWLVLPRTCHLSAVLLISAASVIFRKVRVRHPAPFASSLKLSTTIVVAYESSTLDRLGHWNTFAQQFPFDIGTLLLMSCPAPPTPQCNERLPCDSIAR